jgi:MFS family permease
MGGFVITPLLLQDQFGYDETKTGLLLIARPIVFAITGPVAGYLTVRVVGERSAAVFGAATITASMFALASLAPGDGDAVIVGALALSGLGMGASAPAMAATIANAVDERDLGIAGATQQMVNQVGVVIGIQVMQTVQAARAPAVGAVNAYGEAYLVGAALAACGVVFATFVRSTPRAAELRRGVREAEAAAGAPRPLVDPA